MWPHVEKAINELKASWFTIIEEQPIFLKFREKGCKYFAVRGRQMEKNWNLTRFSEALNSLVSHPMVKRSRIKNIC